MVARLFHPTTTTMSWAVFKPVDAFPTPFQANSLIQPARRPPAVAQSIRPGAADLGTHQHLRSVRPRHDLTVGPRLKARCPFMTGMLGLGRLAAQPRLGLSPGSFSPAPLLSPFSFLPSPSIIKELPEYELLSMPSIVSVQCLTI